MIGPVKVSAAIALLAISLAGCYTYRASLQPGATESPGDKGQGKVIWSFAWGAVSGNPPSFENCVSKAFAEVAVKENPGFWLITLLSLGIASPKRIEWRCAPPNPTEGLLRPDSAGTRPESTGGR